MPTYRIIFTRRQFSGTLMVAAPSEADARNAIQTLFPDAQVISCTRDWEGEVMALKAKLYDMGGTSHEQHHSK